MCRKYNGCTCVENAKIIMQNMNVNLMVFLMVEVYSLWYDLLLNELFLWSSVVINTESRNKS